MDMLMPQAQQGYNNPWSWMQAMPQQSQQGFMPWNNWYSSNTKPQAQQGQQHTQQGMKINNLKPLNQVWSPPQQQAAAPQAPGQTQAQAQAWNPQAAMAQTNAAVAATAGKPQQTQPNWNNPHDENYQIKYQFANRPQGARSF